jgi:two-component system, cell cycle sensor histidine kinase and response regulator CckA
MGPLRVLIADDNAGDCARVEAALAHEFVDVQVAQAADEAGLSHLLRTQPFDLVITDHLSHWTHGLAALRLAKAHNPHLPVLMLTSIGSPEIAVSAMKEGLDDYIVKDREQWPRLSTSVRQLLEHAARRRTVEMPQLERDRFFSLCPDPLCITDLDGRIRQINRAWTEVLGYRIADLESMTSLDLVHPRDLERSVAEVKKLLQGIEIESFENRCRARDGTYRWLLWSATPALEEKAIFAAARDVTERKQAEEALRESEERSRAIVDSSVDAILTIDDAGTIQSVNPVVGQIFGYAPHELLGQNVSILIPSGERAQHAEHLATYVRTGIKRILGQIREVQAVRKDGSHLPIEIQITEFQVLGRRFFSGTMRDLTRIREAEEAGRRQHEILQGVFDHIPVMIAFLDDRGAPLVVNREWERTLGWKLEDAQGLDLLAEMYPERSYRDMVLAFFSAAERRWSEFKTKTKNGSLIDTAWATIRLSDGTAIAIGEDVSERKRLEQQLWQSQKLEAVGRLAGGIAHDFNNVLNVIMGYAEMLARPLPADGPERRKVAKIQKAAERAASLTRQLLAFSRQQVLQPRVLELGTVVGDVMGMLKRSIGEDIEIRSTLNATGRVRADPGQMEQVLLNLAVNARDAMPTGGKLTIETSDAEIDEPYARLHPTALEGRYVMLAVSDNGQGMDPATQARIFEPFFTTKAKGKGTGLGLSTVYGIVKQSGGYVWVYSEPGLGTTFNIYLPRVDAQVASREPAARKEGAITETILVVEDQDAGREMITEILGAEGYRIMAAADGNEAQELARRSPERIDLLLTDVVMPKMSGNDLARALTAHHPDMRVLYMSGYTSEMISHHGVLDEGILFLQKPFTPGALSKRVRQVLDGVT